MAGSDAGTKPGSEHSGSSNHRARDDSPISAARATKKSSIPTTGSGPSSSRSRKPSTQSSKGSILTRFGTQIQVKLLPKFTPIGCNVDIWDVSVLFAPSSIHSALGLVAPINEIAEVDAAPEALTVDFLVAEMYENRPDVTPDELSAGALTE